MAAAEMADRLPAKPFSALAADYPNSGIDMANFMSGRKFPEDVTTYGLFINGVHYVGNCQTRWNVRVLRQHAVRVVFGREVRVCRHGFDVAGRRSGSSVYGELIRNHVPEYVDGGDWTNVTFANTSDMATGNYVSTKEEEDENGPLADAFVDASTLPRKSEMPLRHSLTKQIPKHFRLSIVRDIHPDPGHE